MNNLNFFSIVIITYNREDLVENLLSQIEVQAPQSEIILIHNSNNALNIKNLENRTHFFVNREFSTPAMARNEALKHATRPWLVFFDDDIILPENYFLKAQQFLQNYSSVDLFGGPDQTPEASSFFQIALGLTLQSPMATAHTRLRHLRSNNEKKVIPASERDLILCHLWIKKELFDKHKLVFPDAYFRNEENLLIHQASMLDANILYNSDLFVYHYRKSELKSLFFAVFRSGLYRIKSFREMFSISGLLFLVPIVWLIFLISSLYQFLTLGEVDQYSSYLWLFYLSLSFIATVSVTIKRPQYFFVALFYQFYMNLVYALGTLVGLLRLIFL